MWKAKLALGTNEQFKIPVKEQIKLFQKNSYVKQPTCHNLLLPFRNNSASLIISINFPDSIQPLSSG